MSVPAQKKVSMDINLLHSDDTVAESSLYSNGDYGEHVL